MISSLSFALSFSILTPLIFSLPVSVSAANCNGAQFRRAGDPSGQEISDALLGPHDSTLESVCNGGFPRGSKTISIFNTGTLIYNVTRLDGDQPLRYCKSAFKDIINQCIVSDSYWGGDWSLYGETYAIYDHPWPDHTLPADSAATATPTQEIFTVTAAISTPASSTTTVAPSSTIERSSVTATVCHAERAH